MTVDDRGDVVEIEDLFVDVLIGPPTAPYRVLDLDEFAAAVATGVVDPATARDGLERCERFLDRRLHGPAVAAGSWPDFPPSEVDPARWPDLPSDWIWR